MVKKMLPNFIRSTILKNFFEIPLTGMEAEMAEDAILQKYAVAVRQGALFSILLMPALLTLDTEIVISVLIPTTMVAGTAWFSVSLASMKKKFEDFGMELTTDLFVAFTLSLMMLFLATLFSLTSPLWSDAVAHYAGNPYLEAVSAGLAVLVVGKLLYSIFNGSLKYDINDAMLTGQNEAAERFFKKSLSLLHDASDSLKLDRGLNVANYTIGVAFYEIFNNISMIKKADDSFTPEPFIEKANELISNPSMKQKPADDIARGLVSDFLEICRSAAESDEVSEHKSFKAIEFELECLTSNASKGDGDEDGEDQAMVDTRMSVIFSEISNLVETFGPQLFGE